MHSTPSDAIIIGVDTHKDVHIAVAITGFGAHLGTLSIPATATGYRQLVRWAVACGSIQGLRHRGHRLLRRRPEPGARIPRVPRH